MENITLNDVVTIMLVVYVIYLKMAIKYCYKQAVKSSSELTNVVCKMLHTHLIDSMIEVFKDNNLKIPGQNKNE